MKVTDTSGFNPQEIFARMQTQPLNEAQKTQLTEILAKYDPENFSNHDRAKMRKDLRMAAIPPSQQTFQILEDAGFSKPVGKGALRGGVISHAARNKSTLMELLDELKAGEITDKEFANQVEDIKQELGVSIGEMIDNTIG